MSAEPVESKLSAPKSLPPKPSALKPRPQNSSTQNISPGSEIKESHPPIRNNPVKSNPRDYGHIDNDGSVWLKTIDGERQIGSWQAGTPDEGLAHFGRRFDDLATEVELLEERLAAGSGDPAKTILAATALAETLPTASVLGDIDNLTQRLTKIIDTAGLLTEKIKTQRAEDRTAAIARKEALALEVETIGKESTQWKASGDRLREILVEWKEIRGIDRKNDEALWKRYTKGRDAFNRRRGAHFADLDRERAGSKSQKEKIIEKAEALSTSTDWAETGNRFRELLDEWKTTGRASRDHDDSLWARFKAAQDVFFQARNAATAERDAEFAINAQGKKALLDEFDSKIAPANDLAEARKNFREFRNKWEALGKVPRDKMNSLENGAKEFERRIRDAEENQWRRTDPQAIARAEQFTSRAAQFEEQAIKAEAAGKPKDAAKLRDQAKQWTEWANAAQGAVADR